MNSQPPARAALGRVKQVALYLTLDEHRELELEAARRRCPKSSLAKERYVAGVAASPPQDPDDG